MKKFLIGFSVMATFFAAIFCLGSFRQFLEKRYNNGYEYPIISNGFNFLEERRGDLYEVDESILSVFQDGFFTLFAVCVFLAIFYIFAEYCIEIGDRFFKRTNDF